MNLFYAWHTLLFTFLSITLSASHPTTNTPVSVEDECIKRNSEYLQVFCTYPGKAHPCFTGTLLYKNRPVHLINIEGVAAYLCSRGARIEAATNYCCFTQKCLKLCYEEIDQATRNSTQNA